jgi:N-sulfoglucosamine sulfohydrolase
MRKLALLWFVAVLAGGAIGAFAAGPATPSIVVFLADDHSQSDSSVYGATEIRTPNMERLATAGMTFTHAFVTSPSCAPSRASLLTGLMPARHGAEANHSRPRAAIRKLPAYLHELGYEVAAFGKVSHYQQTADYGFDHFAHDGFHDHRAIPAALKWLAERSSDKPLALFVGSNWPHVPWPEPSDGYDPARVKLPPGMVDTVATREAYSRYGAAVTRMDAELGQVFDAARGRLGSNTLFVHTSDHGAQWPFGKWTCYEAGIRTSLIVVWPGVVAPGTRTDAMVSWVDILPTLVEAAGGRESVDSAEGNGLDGRSFLPVLRGATSGHRDRIFTTHSGDGQMNVFPIRSVRTRQWKFIHNLHPEFKFTTHIDRAKSEKEPAYFDSWIAQAKSDSRAGEIVERYHKRPREELYDLAADPNELHNLAADPEHAECLMAMRAELEAWMKEQGDQRKVFNQPILPARK